MKDSIPYLLFAVVLALLYGVHLKSDTKLKSVIDNSIKVQDSLKVLKDQIINLEATFDRKQRERDSLYRLSLDSLQFENQKIMERIKKYQSDVEILEANFRPIDLPEL